MDLFPVEVVTNIMRFLSIADRKEAALVNKVWYEAFLDPMLLQDIVVSFPSHAGSEIFPSLVRRRMPNIILEQFSDSVEREMASNRASDYLAHHLLSLSLRGSDITEITFVKVLAKCCSLEKLDLSCCNSLFMSGNLLSKPRELAAMHNALQQLKELNLSSIRHLTDSSFNRIVSVAPKLEKLILTSDQILFCTDGYFSGIPGKSAVLTFTNLYQLLSERATQIKMLGLSRTTINDKHLLSLAKVPHLKLEELELVKCQNLTAGGLVEFCKHQTEVTSLDLSHCMEVNDSVVSAICSGLPLLQGLALNNCRMISDTGISRLFKLEDLRSLDLSSCYHISARGLDQGLCKVTHSNLKHLTLNCCSNVKDEFMIDACKVLTGLTHLDLGSTLITDRSVLLISKFLTRLGYLRLAWCKLVSDDGLLGNLQILDRIHHEEEEGTCRCTRQREKSHIFNKPVQYRDSPSPKHSLELEMKVRYALGERPVPLSNLQLLVKLDLNACPKVTDQGLVVILPRLTRLRCLSLSMCIKVTDVTLAAVARSNVSLEELDISHNSNYTDPGLRGMTQRLRRLTSLNVSNCDRLTDRGIEDLQRHCRRLKNLDVSLNVNVTAPALEKVTGGLMHLQEVHKRLIGQPYENVAETAL